MKVTAEDLQKDLQKRKPQLQRLKMLMEGVRIGRVLGNRVLVKTIKPYTEMDRLEELAKQGKRGGLHMPETVKEENTPLPSCGYVIGLGNTAEVRMPNGEVILREGNCVMFSKHAGSDFSVANEDFRIMDMAEVMCVLEGAEVELDDDQP
jgi:co-chaperonin GroES (HSP10)